MVKKVEGEVLRESVVDVSNLPNLSAGELGGKQMLGNFLLSWMSKEMRDDPRYEVASEKLRAEVKALNAELARRAKVERESRGEGEPQPVVIGMKTLVMAGRAPRPG